MFIYNFLEWGMGDLVFRVLCEVFLWYVDGRFVCDIDIDC